MKIFYGLLLVVYGAFHWWYGGSGEPVTAQELEAYIAQVQKNAEAVGDDAEESAQYMRNLVASDNGDEFYMVNLMNYRERAQYPAGSPWADDPDAMAADARYAELIVPLLLKRGSHPVLVGPLSGVFIIEGEWGNWDAFAVVRYRSVRDMLEMIVDMSELGDVAVHKWASMEATQVFPVSASISLLNAKLLFGALLLVIAVVVRAIAGFVRSD